jgi:hypothetical protein
MALQAMQTKRIALMEGLARERQIKEGAMKTVELKLQRLEDDKAFKREEKMECLRQARAVQMQRERRDEERYALVSDQRSEELSMEQLAVCL